MLRTRFIAPTILYFLFTSETIWDEIKIKGSSNHKQLTFFLSTISTHQMSCFKLPKTSLDNMNGITSNFWWGRIMETTKFIDRVGQRCAKANFVEGMALEN